MILRGDCNSRTEYQKQETSINVPNSKFTTKSQPGSEPEVHTSAADGQTALHLAVRNGHLEMVRFLLERGANVNKPDERGWTPKSLAETQANKGMYDLILNYENEKKLDGAINHATNHYKTHAYISSTSSIHPTHEEARKTEKRVTIHIMSEKKNHSQKQPPKLIILPVSLEELLKVAGMHHSKSLVNKQRTFYLVVSISYNCL